MLDRRLRGAAGEQDAQAAAAGGELRKTCGGRRLPARGIGHGDGMERPHPGAVDGLAQRLQQRLVVEQALQGGGGLAVKVRERGGRLGVCRPRSVLHAVSF
ncbi:MAG: hypothetical protein U0X20_12230 [Caldilineaceae bacterium]